MPHLVISNANSNPISYWLNMDIIMPLFNSKVDKVLPIELKNKTTDKNQRRAITAV